MTDVWRIDCPSDKNAIFGKFDDFSPKSIERLIQNGKSDAILSLNTLEILFEIRELLSVANSKTEEKQLFNIMTMPKKWLFEHLNYRHKPEMTGYIKEFIIEVEDSIIVQLNTRKLLKTLATNILNDLNRSNISSLTSINPTYSSHQLQTI
jgi:hypothetical protein